VRAVLECAPPVQLLHVYGPTESTTFATWHRVEAVPEEATTLPIGRPISNTEAFLLDAQLQPVPVGVPAELYLGGDGLARGYLHRAALSAETFIPHPFSAVPGARLYKTGDWCRYLPDGSLEFLRRRDAQVKIRGFRIEPGEVEATLAHHPEVREAVVMVREDEPGVKQLVAYVVGAEQAELSRGALRRWVTEALPEYMVPSAFVQLEALPLTPNGKIDRRALPVPEDQRQMPGAYTPPQTETERAVAAVWQATLHLEQLGVHDNFFALGGHSLLATQVINRLRDACAVELPLRSLFVYPTVAELAQEIDTLLWATRGREAPSGPGPGTREKGRI